MVKADLDAVLLLAGPHACQHGSLASSPLLWPYPERLSEAHMRCLYGMEARLAVDKWQFGGHDNVNVNVNVNNLLAISMQDFDNSG